jgi:hypothetical protein
VLKKEVEEKQNIQQKVIKEQMKKRKKSTIYSSQEHIQKGLTGQSASNQHDYIYERHPH